jgi:hypothetical protein
MSAQPRIEMVLPLTLNLGGVALLASRLDLAKAGILRGSG